MRIPQVSIAYATETPLNDNSFEPKSKLEIALWELRLRQPIYNHYANYYDGNHDLRISVEKMRNTFGYLFCTFADNLMPTVVDSMAERLEVTGFDLKSQKNNDRQVMLPLNPHTLPNSPNYDANNTQNGNNGGNNNNGNGSSRNGANRNNGANSNGVEFETLDLPQQQKTIADKAWDLWDTCRMQEVQIQVYLETLISGDSYVVVWPNPKQPGKVCVHPQKASEFYMEEDRENPGMPLYAAKVWREKKRIRVTLYFDDRIEKYISIEGRKDPKRDTDFEHYIAVTNGETEDWPLPNPYKRVPAFKFSNKSRMGGMGKSELKDVIPLQDALNKALMDLMVAMEFAALQQRWATGIEVQKDPVTGESKSGFESGMDKLWYSSAPDAHFGEFAAADLNAFIQVHDSLRLEIARISRTPLHYFTIQTGNAPSGAALRTIEKPLVAKCETAQVALGDTWEDVTEFMLFVAGDSSNTNQSQLEAIWKPARSEDEKEDLETAVLKESLGVSEMQLQRELGYSNQQIQAMQIEKASKQNYDNQQTLNETTFAFDRGNNFGANNIR